MEIFIASFNTETNTISSFPTSLDDFLFVSSEHYKSSPSIIENLGPVAVWTDLGKNERHSVHFGGAAIAEPSGRIIESDYEFIRDSLLSNLKLLQHVDIVLLDLHGAMSSSFTLDCEGDILTRVRNIVGPNTIIGVELDLHGHISQTMLDSSDIIVAYKEYPHVDINSRAEELYRLSIDTAENRIKPVMSVVECGMISIFPTTSQIMQSYLKKIRDIEQATNEVLSISVMHGFPWGDCSDAGVKVLVVTNGSEEIASQVAKQFASELYSIRKLISFESHELNVSLTKAISAKEFPVVVADQSDNPGGGAPSDSTYALEWLLKNKVSNVILAFIFDPEVVKLAKKVGVGEVVSTRVGGKVGKYSGAPIDLQAEVISICENYTHCFPQENGEDLEYELGDVAVIRASDIDIVLSSKRSQCFSYDFIDKLGLNIKRYKIYVVKSTQHFYSSYSKIAKEVVYMSAPGAICPDIKNINYTNIDTKSLFPWCEVE